MVWCATAEKSNHMTRGKCLANGGKGFNTYTAARTEQRRLTTDVSYRLEEAKKHKAKKDKAKKEKTAKDKAKKEKERQLRKEREVKEARQRDQTQAYSAIGALVGRIGAKVRENWNKPPFSIRGLETVISVKVQRTGEVVSVRVVKSSGNDYFDQSAENAVYKASPLPFPDEPRYYEFLKEFDFKFAPDESNVYSDIVLPNSDPIVWCASASGVTLENRSSCISNAGGSYASEDQANRENHRLKHDVSNKLEETISYAGGTYTGPLVNGVPHGQGALTFSDGAKYVGEWNDGKRRGQGTFTWPNGEKYVGKFKDDNFNGQGTLSALKGQDEGLQIVGEWKNGELHGQGTMTTPIGEKYVGEWKATLMHGRGTYTWSDGGKYIGEFKDGKKHGHGTYTDASGTGYGGEWNNNKRWKGTEYDKDGNAIFAYLEGGATPLTSVWCANKGGVEYRTASSCQERGGKGYSSIDMAHAENNKHRLKPAPSTSTASSSSSNDRVWCVYRNGSNLKFTNFSGTYCRQINGQSFGTRALASAEHQRLKSASAIPMVWCATSDSVTKIARQQCQVKHGLVFPLAQQNDAYREHQRLKSASAIPMVWCATSDSVTKIARQQCQIKQGHVFSSRETARAEHQRLRVVSLEKQIKQTKRLLQRQNEVISLLQQAQTTTGKLTIQSNVRGDKVYIDGVHKGSTRLDLDLPRGRHTIRIEKEGYKAYEKEIDLVDTIKLQATLERLRSQVRHALVIGNSKYTHSPLKNPKNDAEDLAAALRSIGFSVNQLTDASRTEMRHAIRDFGNKLAVNRDSTGLFFYAGHGVQSKGTNFLIPIGADINKAYELSDEAVRAESVIGSMDEAGNQMNIIILDACRNNPYRSLFRGGTRGLKQMQASRGMWIAFSTAPGELSVDGEGRNSPYTRHLIEAIKTPGLSIEQVFKTVRRGVIEDTLEE